MNTYTLENLIGDVPVSEQIGIAIENHTHEEYATRQEFEDLKRKIEMLYDLVGDIPVSDQISMAIKNIK